MSDVYLGGIGILPFRKYAERGIVSLGGEAARNALIDGGLRPDEVDAGYFSNVLGSRLFGDFTIGQNVFGAIGIAGIPITNVENACASGSTAFISAVNAIRAGEASVVLVVGAEKMCVPQMGLLNSGETEVNTLLGLVTPASFALRAQRHMFEYGTTAGQLAAISVKNRRHAALNPAAMYQQPISLEEVLASPVIADPLTRLQSCPMADGAAAVVLLSQSEARRRGAKVRVEAAVLCTGSYHPQPDLARWETDYRGARLAYERAGIGPDAVDLVECHDAFSISELLHYEALGLCQAGEGGRLVDSGATALGGLCPVNPSGGLLSRGHPLGATGVAQLVEVTRQLRGLAGPGQVPGARVGLAHCMGGDKDGDTKSCTVIILGKQS